ncbi:type II toxin-antitoxin system VapC family toxin [Litorilinea aerophila]|uniref:Type II toxin-antitoxin system VapC family toxin n=1 Tax=Litorilinea aerophila TaxID=1204385 RepID=A0A540VJ24_9CHLR|nr:type II toxin-antitoxin system VapC family toxin [Litorilinea aerophila]MCC9075619.1 type II toxin-antitoxin system VapC family toxin [Litorilinea aerophila]GIV79173.1 MAG: twitching motility protein PilT [Litorilinea sp.]
MILYLDASAFVKRYVAEAGSEQVGEAIAQAELVGTAMISRAEVAAALAKAMRMGMLEMEETRTALQIFRREWPHLVRVPITETVVARADSLAWEYGLRGYDAVHLASALIWQEMVGEPVTLSAFDLRLWQAAVRAGLSPHPDDLPALLASWQRAS